MTKSKNLATTKHDETSMSVKEYASTLAELKKQIKESQIRAVTAANNELVHLYWTVGRIIVDQQERSGWGSGFVDKLAKDLQNEFPGIEGFSRTNIFRMRAFFLAYKKVTLPVGQLDDLGVLAKIPWSHNIVLMEKIEPLEERLWYAQKTIEHGWSRTMLEMWIKSDLYHREGRAVTNFQNTLPDPQSDLAQQTLKDPYLLDFISLREDYTEKDLENGLIDHIQKFLLELGSGFAYLGRQVNLCVGDQDFFIDLLFYHVKLRCYVVVELKATEFKPEYAGKMNFYLNAVDKTIKHEDDKPTIGLLLCKTKNKVIAEYTLQGINKPLGVAEYETMLTGALPKDMKSSLPTIKEIEEELGELS